MFELLKKIGYILKDDIEFEGIFSYKEIYKYLPEPLIKKIKNDFTDEKSNLKIFSKVNTVSKIVSFTINNTVYEYNVSVLFKQILYENGYVKEKVAEYLTELIQYGNSLGIRIQKAYLDQLKKGDIINVEISTIRPKENKLITYIVGELDNKSVITTILDDEIPKVINSEKNKDMIRKYSYKLPYHVYKEMIK